MNLIEVKDLSFYYESENLVLDKVSFVIESGKYYSIIGHNGSGKSTLAKLLMGLLVKKGGSLTAFDLAYNKTNIEKIRSRIGIVFQNPDNQFIGSTVQDDIAFGLENRRVPHEDMMGIIETFTKEVGMEDYLEKEPEMLSGGQKQRVAIAGVLALNPDVIIFDEATSMLDPVGRRDVRNTIAHLREKNPNLALISITHDIEEAFQSDEIIVLEHGKVFAKGTPEEILKKAAELERIGLSVPFLYKVNQELNSRGLKVNEYKDIARMVDEICK